MIQNMMRKGMASGSSGFAGVTLNFGSLDMVSSMELPPHWANDLGGDPSKALAKNVSLAPLVGGATISLTAVPTFRGPPTMYYSKNDGPTITYEAPFSVLESDSLKIGGGPPAGFSAAGAIVVNADGQTVSSITYYWADET
jgi:hypothetical protein